MSTQSIQEKVDDILNDFQRGRNFREGARERILDVVRDLIGPMEKEGLISIPSGSKRPIRDNIDAPVRNNFRRELLDKLGGK